jgi:NAD(P)H-dependent flavin oxidoreductase YrpB (nitropropane dioxygenase family)
MRTRVADIAGIELPIFAFSHCRDVVAAVTNAGGMGVLGAVAHSPRALEVDLAWIDQQVGGKPYGVDLLLPTRHAGAAHGAELPAEQQAFVADLLDRYGVSEGTDGDDAPARPLAVADEDVAALLDVAFAHPIRLIASALGPPTVELVERAHGRNVMVAALAGTVEHARRHRTMGVDLIVAQGTEAGGHTGEVATMVLVPDVVDAVTPTPVLAAGGIARGRQIAAALALGADGVWCGSVWLATREAETDPVVQAKFLEASSSDTVRSRSLTGKPARMLRTAWTDEWARAEAPAALPMPLQSLLVAPAQRRINRLAAGHDGAGRLATYFVGQVVGSLDRVRPARQVVAEMVDEYLDTVTRLHAHLET